jgi:hypothetical protein
VYKLQGKWNSHLDAFKCDADGEPLEGEEPLRLWTVRGQPAGPGEGSGHTNWGLRQQGRGRRGGEQQRVGRLPSRCS